MHTNKILIIVSLIGVAIIFYLIGRVSTPPPKVEPDAKSPTSQEGKTQQQPRYVLESIRVSPMLSFTTPENIEKKGEKSPYLGPAEAKVTIVVVSDFQCPVCKRASQPLKDLLRDFQGNVRIVFKHNPLQMHKDALNSAVASLSAHRQNKFWEYHDILFSNQQDLSEEALFKYAQQLGLNMEIFKKDFNDPVLREKVLNEGKSAEILEASGTPAFFINGKLQVGWASYSAIKQQVEMELKEVNNLIEKGLNLKDIYKKRVLENNKKGEEFLKLYFPEEI